MSDITTMELKALIDRTFSSRMSESSQNYALRDILKKIIVEIEQVDIAAGVSGYSGKSGYSGYSGLSGYSGATGAGTSGFSGYSGSNGSQGTSGYSGISGWSGYSGYSGAAGLTGTSGFSGYSGAIGASGTSGYSGYSGYSGISGYSGTNGASGTSGYSGWSGISGFSGYSGTANGGAAVVADANYTLVIGDAGAMKAMNSASARQFIVPPNSSVPFNIGESISFARLGAGTVTLTPGSGVTFLSAGDLFQLRAVNSVGSICKLLTNTWIVGGDLA